MYSGKSGCIRAEWLYSEYICCLRANVIVFGQSGCIWAKVVVYKQGAHDGPGVGRVQKGSAISLRFFQDKMASTELNERKRFRSSSDSDVTLSPGSEPRKRKFEVSEEEWLSVLQRVKDLEAKQLTDTKRIENLSTELTASQEENGVLKRELMALQDSLEFSQKEQDEVKGRVEHVEVDAVSNKNRIIKQELYNRRWNLLFLRGERRVW